MPFTYYTPFDCLPRRLNLEEMGNPLLVIHEFFDWENLPVWRAHLDKWLCAGLTPGFQLSREDLVELLVRYDYIETLIEALSIINNSFKNPHLLDLKIINAIDYENDRLTPIHIDAEHGNLNKEIGSFPLDEQEYHPVFLNEGEKKHPYRSIQIVFENYCLPEFRDALYWWYFLSIDRAAAENREMYYLKDIHLIFQKAIELSHLIHIRTENPQL